MKYLAQNDHEQLTIQDLVDKMSEFNNSPYSTKHMKRKLIEHLGNSIFISDSIGGSSLVTIRERVSDILQDFKRNFDDANEESSKVRIIKAAADIIKSDVKMMMSDKYFYPDPETISSINENLNFLLSSLKSI